eukprot:1152440-Pelagomonas_calceolata.AAC.8
MAVGTEPSGYLPRCAAAVAGHVLQCGASQETSFEGRQVRDTATGVPFGYTPPTVFSAALQVGAWSS